MRIVQLREEASRLVDSIDSEIETLDRPVAEPQTTRLISAIRALGRERKERLCVFFAWNENLPRVFSQFRFDSKPVARDHEQYGKYTQVYCERRENAFLSGVDVNHKISLARLVDQESSIDRYR